MSQRIQQASEFRRAGGLAAPIYQQSQEQVANLIDVPSSNSNQLTGANNNELIGYYFGSISRETAEWILKTHGNQADGAYLLRSSGPNDDFVLSLLVVDHIGNNNNNSAIIGANQQFSNIVLDVLHYKIIETEDSFVALHGQVGNEKFATIDELIDKTQGVATKPRWPIHRHLLESQILPPTYWGLTVDQVRLAILIKAKQWGFPLLSTLFQQQQYQNESAASTNNSTGIGHQSVAKQKSLSSSGDAPNESNLSAVTTLNNETIRTLIYKSLHEFQPWFHGKISREEAERRIEENPPKDGRFLVRERDNYSYAICISHKKATKHYRVDVTPTGELAIQDGRKFTSLMALVSHYTIMSDGLWCALTEPCPRPIQNFNGNLVESGMQNGIPAGPFAMSNSSNNRVLRVSNSSGLSALGSTMNQSIYCVPPMGNDFVLDRTCNNHSSDRSFNSRNIDLSFNRNGINAGNSKPTSLMCPNQGAVTSLKAPIKEWIQNINHKWSQLMAAKNHHQSLNSFLFGSQNPLNNHCRHGRHHSRHHNHHINRSRRKCKNGHSSCGCNGHFSANSSADAMSQSNCTLKSQETSLRKQQSANNANTLLPSSTRMNDMNAMPLAASSNRNQPERVSMSDSYNCCRASNHLTKTITQQYNGVQPKNHVVLSNSSFVDATNDQHCNNLTTNLLLSRLPQNSGFTLNSQSIIGSPLFAVRQQQVDGSIALETQTPGNNRSKNGSSGSNSGSGSNSYNVEEEKLISPAQSVSANLNNHYNLNADIYGSQSSTAIVNDPTQTSSSSSSGLRQSVIRRDSGGLRKGPHVPEVDNHQSQVQHGAVPKVAMRTKLIAGNQAVNGAQMSGMRNQPSSRPRHAGPILCGQHAGPAYRYTNCSDENSFRTCLHRPLLGYRAADDSQLMTPSTQLTGPAAMAKFVQFQDGQCLRTHRDTRSIQMAFLSSKQGPQYNKDSTNPMNNQNLTLSKQVAARGASSYQNETFWNIDTVLSPDQINQNFMDASRHCSVNTQNIKQRPDVTSFERRETDENLASGRSNFHVNQNSNVQGNNAINTSGWTQASCGVDADLMDCREYDDYDFKYDPKLIKSSSIETLCGAGDNEPVVEDLSGFKTNAELVMSLQPCWHMGQAQQGGSDILSPIPINNFERSSFGGANGIHDDDTQHSQGDHIISANIVNSFASASTVQRLVDETNEIDHIREHLDSMNKKHDLEELTTALLAELTASLKAQVDLKNKRSGLGFSNLEKTSDDLNSRSVQPNNAPENCVSANCNSSSAAPGTNPRELVNEFDTLLVQNR